MVVPAAGTIRRLVKFPSVFTHPQRAILNKQTTARTLNNFPSLVLASWWVRSNARADRSLHFLFVLQQSHHVKLGMSGSLNRFTAAAEFQTRHPVTSANACVHPVAQDGSLQSSFSWMSLNEFTEGRRHRGHLVSSPIVAWSYTRAFVIKGFSSISGAQPFIEKYQKSTETKQNTNSPKKASNLKVQFRSRIQK